MPHILLAEPSYILRKGFHSLLEQFQEVESVSEATSREECLEHLQSTHQTDLVVINTSLLQLISLKEIEEHKDENCQVLYIFNTGIPEESPINHLSVLDSKTVLSEKIYHFLEIVMDKSNLEEENEEELSSRERLILQQVALGQTNKEIASKLFISTHTVISHRKNITRKLGIKTVAGLTVYAILNNLIQMEDLN